MMSASNSGGAPLKPWEMSRIESKESGSEEPTSKPYYSTTSYEDQQRQQQNQIVSSYPPYSRFNSTYTPQYHSHAQYGMSNGYYGYSSTYGGHGMYGGYGNTGTMYGYGRPTSWSQPPIYPGMPPPEMDIPKPPMWQRFLDGLHKVVSAFGRVSFLVDENTQAFHFFITALLALMDKAGSLYGELARYILKLLGFGRRSKLSILNQSQQKHNIAPFQIEQIMDEKSSSQTS